MTKITAEFESPELAESALRRVKESRCEIISSNIMYNKTSDRAMKLRHGSIYTIIPTAVTTHNYVTAVLESPASEDVIIEPMRSRKAVLCCVCGDEHSKNVKSILSAMGGLSVNATSNKS